MLYDNSTTNVNGNASISSNDTGVFFGQDVELPSYLTPDAPYTIWLNVTSTDSLIGSTHIVYVLS